MSCPGGAVHLQVDEPGRRDQPAGVYDAGARGRCIGFGAQGGDPTAVEEDRADASVEGAGVPEEEALERAAHDARPCPIGNRPGIATGR